MSLSLAEYTSQRILLYFAFLEFVFYLNIEHFSFRADD